MKSQRSLKYLLSNPDTQIGYGLLFLTFVMVFHVVITLVAISLYAAYTTGATEVTGMPVWVMFALIVLIYICMYAFAFTLGLLFSHRMYGPLVNIEKFLTQIKSGNFSARLTIRKKDNKKIRELVDSLNELAESLEKRSL